MVGTRPGFVSSFTNAVVPAPSCPPIKHINKPDNNNTSRVSNCLIMAINVATTITTPAITIISPIRVFPTNSKYSLPFYYGIHPSNHVKYDILAS